MKTRPLTQPLAACLRAILLLLCLHAGSALHAQTTNAADATATGNAANTSLVPDGDFQSAAADSTWPATWVPAKGATWETENGKHFIRLAQQDPGAMLMAYREVSIPAGVKSLTITIRYRTNGVVAGAQSWNDARGIFHFIDSNRKQLTPDPGVIGFSKDASDWTTVSENVTVPDTADKMMLMPCLFQAKSGTLDLASVNITANQ